MNDPAFSLRHARALTATKFGGGSITLSRITRVLGTLRSVVSGTYNDEAGKQYSGNRIDR